VRLRDGETVLGEFFTSSDAKALVDKPATASTPKP